MPRLSLFFPTLLGLSPSEKPWLPHQVICHWSVRNFFSIVPSFLTHPLPAFWLFVIEFYLILLEVFEIRLLKRYGLWLVSLFTGNLYKNLMCIFPSVTSTSLWRNWSWRNLVKCLRWDILVAGNCSKPGLRGAETFAFYLHGRACAHKPWVTGRRPPDPAQLAPGQPGSTQQDRYPKQSFRPLVWSYFYDASITGIR